VGNNGEITPFSNYIVGGECDVAVMCIFRLQYYPSQIPVTPMDNLHYRLIFDLGKSGQSKPNSRKDLLKVVKFQNVVAKCGGERL
jgi:hypothetical protein